MEDSNNDEIVALATRKKELIQAFLELTQAQAEAIRTENFDSILNLINQKQNIIEQVNLLDLESLNHIPADDQDLVRQTKELMAVAIVLDHENIQALQQNRDLMFEKLKAAKQNTKVHSIYRGAGQPIEGVFLDKRK
ncbi:MAG TPA: hypothetical protein VN441_16400 [Syntrophomonas sp.]|nr:hypothetical protein [Syntrophomonas sp.]